MRRPHRNTSAVPRLVKFFDVKSAVMWSRNLHGSAGKRQGLPSAQLHVSSLLAVPWRHCCVDMLLTWCRSTFRVVMEGKFTLPDTMSPHAADLITQLLQVVLQLLGFPILHAAARARVVSCMEGLSACVELPVRRTWCVCLAGSFDALLL